MKVQPEQWPWAQASVSLFLGCLGRMQSASEVPGSSYCDWSPSLGWLIYKMCSNKRQKPTLLIVFLPHSHATCVINKGILMSLIHLAASQGDRASVNTLIGVRRCLGWAAMWLRTVCQRLPRHVIKPGLGGREEVRGPDSPCTCGLHFLCLILSRSTLRGGLGIGLLFRKLCDS